MIVIIVFVAVIVWIFRYNYLRISDAECRKNTTDGVTYIDAFGNVRLLRDGKKVYHRKNIYGQWYMCYGNGVKTNTFQNLEDEAKFKGEKEYVCDKKNGILLYKIFDTGEVYAKYSFGKGYKRSYYIEYNEDRPMKVIRETDDTWGNPKYGDGINIERMNEVFKKMYDDKFMIFGDYFIKANNLYFYGRYVI